MPQILNKTQLRSNRWQSCAFRPGASVVPIVILCHASGKLDVGSLFGYRAMYQDHHLSDPYFQ